MFSACKTYEKQLGIEKTRLSHQVWSHGGSTFEKKKRTLNGHFSRPAETDPYEDTEDQENCQLLLSSWKDRRQLTEGVKFPGTGKRAHAQNGSRRSGINKHRSVMCLP